MLLSFKHMQISSKHKNMFKQLNYFSVLNKKFLYSVVDPIQAFSFLVIFGLKHVYFRLFKIIF